MSGPDPACLETYFQMMNFNAGAQVYHVARETGVLEALAGEANSMAAIAQTCQMQQRPVQLLLDALEALGLVAFEQAEYRLTDVTQMLLFSDYRELGNQYWGHLPEYLRSGVPLKRMDNVAESETHYQAQAAALGWMLGSAAEAAAKKLELGTRRRGLRILDVGAGSAAWSLSMARADVDSHVTAVDWPAVLEVAVEMATQMEVSDQLTVLPGNFHEVELPCDTFDLAVVANVTHLESPEGNVNLFRKLHAALRIGGEIAVIDILPGAPQGEVARAVYCLGLALRTERGEVFSSERLSQFLSEAGFGPAELLPIDAPPHTIGMLLANK